MNEDEIVHLITPLLDRLADVDEAASKALQEAQRISALMPGDQLWRAIRAKGNLRAIRDIVDEIVGTIKP